MQIGPIPKPNRDLSNEEINPPYYQAGDQYEVIKVIEAWQLNFDLGNAVKYIARAGRKPGASAVTDLQKAQWYLNREIEKFLE